VLACSALLVGLGASLLADGPTQTLNWIDQKPLLPATGSTVGVPWAKGLVKPGSHFSLKDSLGKSQAVQSWVLATWPDGSLKWTAHAWTGTPASSGSYTLSAGDQIAPAPASPVVVTEDASGFKVATGAVTVDIPRSGPALVSRMVVEGREVATDGKLVLWRQDSPSLEAGEVAQVESFHGEVSKVVVEQSGPVRAVVRIEGSHRADKGERAWLPFIVRLYFHAGSPSVRMMHTIIFDGDEQKDFIRGLGVRFAVPMRDAFQDRHVRLSGEGEGLFAEGIRTVTGLRRDPGEKVRAAQIAGTKTPDPASWAWDTSRGRINFDYVPAWGDFTLSQLNADGFVIRKRTKPGHGWITAGAGQRSNGLAYVGGVSGGLSIGVRDFWQKHPAQLDIRNAASERAELTAWLWAPDAQPMDLRFYHDGMGMNDHDEEIIGLNITYEDYEKGFGSPVGVARTSELMLFAHAATPSREVTAAEALTTALPPQASATPADLAAAGVFGMWDLPDRSTPLKAAIEDRNEALIQHYRDEVEARHWYGFWDYGDVMHAYDDDRQVWRYDVGGYAWDNSELSPDLWLWYSFLRSGKAGTFRFAEAMTRHTGEVDVYHLGRFKGLGSRHNVQHWGCSAKQMRISNAAYRRFYYYLTADERVGDLLHETFASADAYLALDPLRKVRGNRIPPPRRDAVSVGFGTDWGAYSAAMLTEWERTGDPAVRARIEASMSTIAAQPRGFFTGSSFLNLDTSAFSISEDPKVSVSHLSAVFGLPEMCAELLDLIPMPAFEKAWLQYCRLYNAPDKEQQAELGQKLRGTSLRMGHSRLTAYAAVRLGDKALLQRAWSEFSTNEGSRGEKVDFAKVNYIATKGPFSLNPVTHIEGLSTNDSSQWGLAAIQVMAAESLLKKRQAASSSK